MGVSKRRSGQSEEAMSKELIGLGSLPEAG